MLNVDELARIKAYCFPRTVIGYAARAYHRFALSLRDVEDLLVERGIIVSHQTIRLNHASKLGAYSTPKAKLAPGVEHRQHKGINNAADVSHRHTRRKKKVMGRFKSPLHAQRFLSVHDQTAAIFRPRCHRLSALTTDMRDWTRSIATLPS